MRFSTVLSPLLALIVLEMALPRPLVLAAEPGPGLEVLWSSSSETRSLKSWPELELLRLKSRAVQEQDPITGKISKWNGIPLSRLIDEALEKLTVEQKAQIDLVVFRNAEGGQALVPRYVISRYPLILGTHRQGSRIEGGLTVVVPLTSAPKIQSEGLPLGTYALDKLTLIELTSYSNRFSGLFLKRRTDPAAIRGETMFVRNCISCHSETRGKPLPPVVEARSLASLGHPAATGVPRLSERDARALASYLEAFRSENPRTGTTPRNVAGNVTDS
ncbi:MAG: cytochrome c [Oligoflexia bacterium]|nr:cytochrome c [Oligoflexia bacterium]